MAQAWSNIEWRKITLFCPTMGGPSRTDQVRAEPTLIPVDYETAILRGKAAGTGRNDREGVEMGVFAQRLVAGIAEVVVAVVKLLAVVRVGGGLRCRYPRLTAGGQAYSYRECSSTGVPGGRWDLLQGRPRKARWRSASSGPVAY